MIEYLFYQRPDDEPTALSRGMYLKLWQNHTKQKFGNYLRVCRKITFTTLMIG